MHAHKYLTWSEQEIFHLYLLHTQAWLCSHTFNNLLRQLGREPCFCYLISGGDESLIVSNELPEDDPPLGKPCELWPLWCVSSPIYNCFDRSWLLLNCYSSPKHQQKRNFNNVVFVIIVSKSMLWDYPVFNDAEEVGYWGEQSDSKQHSLCVMCLHNWVY